MIEETVKICIDCPNPTRFGADRCVKCSAAHGGFFVRNPKHISQYTSGKQDTYPSLLIDPPEVSRDTLPRGAA